MDEKLCPMMKDVTIQYCGDKNMGSVEEFLPCLRVEEA